MKEPHKRAQLKVTGLMKSVVSLMFLNGALESGILRELKKPMTFDEPASLHI